MTIIVQGASKTGKSTFLKKRMAALFEDNSLPQPRILMIHAAPPANDHALIQETPIAPPSLHRTTFLGLCLNILREFASYASLKDNFEVLSPEAAHLHLDQTMNRWFHKVASDPPPGVRRVLLTKPDRTNPCSPKDTLRHMVHTLAHTRHEHLVCTRPIETPHIQIDEMLDEMKAFSELTAQLNANDEDFLISNLQDIARSYRRIEKRKSLKTYGDDILFAELLALSQRSSWRWRGKRPAIGGINRDTLLARRDSLKSQLDNYISTIQKETTCLLELEISEVLQKYEEVKIRHHTLDERDVLAKSTSIVQQHSEVRHILQNRYDYVYIDDFHLLTSTEAQMALLLVANDPQASSWQHAIPVPNKLVLTADPITRAWDDSAYLNMKQHLIHHGAEVIHLHKRAHYAPEINRLIHTAYSKLLVDYALEPITSSPSDSVHQPQLITLVPHCPDNRYGRILPFQIEQSLPEAIATFIQFVLQHNQWQANSCNPDLRAPITLDDIALLFPNAENSANEDTRIPYMKALESRGLPYTAKETLQSFTARDEIRAIHTLLLAIERPHDELTVYATLRGPWFSFSDESLFLFRERFGSLRAKDVQLPLGWDEANQEDIKQVSEIASILVFLARLHHTRNQRALIDTLDEILDYSALHINVAFWASGIQALQSIDMLYALASECEHTRAMSFRAFVNYIDPNTEHGYLPVPQQRSLAHQIHMLRVEEAIERDFAMAILCNPTANTASFIPAYQAASCAKDILVLPMGENAPIQGWLDSLNTVITAPASACTVTRWEASQWQHLRDNHAAVRYQHALEPHPQVHDMEHVYSAWKERQHALRTMAGTPSLPT